MTATAVIPGMVLLEHPYLRWVAVEDIEDHGVHCLADAWAVAEAALPEGWRLSLDQQPQHYAAFATPPVLMTEGATVGIGPTPTEALLVLAARLRSAV